MSKEYKVRIYRDVKIKWEDMKDYPGMLPYTKACTRLEDVLKEDGVDMMDLINRGFFIDADLIKEWS